jgi:proliferating cell nuclear antigen
MSSLENTEIKKKRGRKTKSPITQETNKETIPKLNQSVILIEENEVSTQPDQVEPETTPLINQKNILEFKTMKSNIIKCLVEVLKEILLEGNIEFTESGMRLTAIDNNERVYVDMQLHAAEIEHYKCLKKKIVIGIDMSDLYRVLRIITPKSTIGFYLEDTNKDVLNIVIENSKKNKIVTATIKLLELDVEKHSPKYSDVVENVIMMPSSEFQQNCKNLNYIGGINTEIKSFDNKIILTTETDRIKMNTIIGESSNMKMDMSNKKEIIQGVFPLKYLISFTKCTALSDNVKIYLKNDKPLIVEYAIASLGEIKFCIASI